MFFRLAVALVVVLLLGAGCSGSPAAAPTAKPASTPQSPAAAPAAGEVQVSIQGFAFGPQSLTVAPGTTVVWTNKDSAAHTVTNKKGAFDSGSLAQGKTFSFKLSQAGAYDYVCSFHANMTAAVNVQ